ncbi:MAG: glycosyltransferase family 4 protein [Kofleriaceae bacterium]
MMRDRNIRMLYLQPAAHFGGAERQAATIMPLLGEFGIEAIPLVGPGHEITNWLEANGIDNYVLTNNFPGGWTKPHGLARMSLPWRYARCVRDFRDELEQLIRDRDIDVLFAAMAFSWIAATPVAHRLGVPIVWRAGGTECSGAQRTVLSAWTRWHRPEWLVCNGEAVQHMYAPLVRAPSRMIRNGLDAHQFHPGAGDPTRLRPPGARVVIGFAARLVPQKRPEDFIEAAARFADQGDVAFLFAGDGSRLGYYTELARSRGASTLHVTGYLRDMRDFYAACDVLVLPSRSEGCPNVVLEAMAMRTVVVAADAPATREIVTSGHDGILYPVGDVDALQRALATLIYDAEARRKLCASGYGRACQLTARECAARTAALLRDVVAAHQPQRALATTPNTVQPAWRNTRAGWARAQDRARSRRRDIRRQDRRGTGCRRSERSARDPLQGRGTNRRAGRPHP